MVGLNIGKYRVIDRVGRGGMGTVYRAFDETLHREVAIKVLNAELNDPEIAKRFRAEAITVARLSHPGIATIYELFQYEGQWLMVMEFVRGETLDRMVERGGALPAERAAEICMQALAALAHAHSMGVVHRDLKPANIMITEGGAIKIMDFGIARVAGTEHLTSAGFMMGTPAYMAPEQVMGQEIDARADIYSMGVVFYRLTTAKLPFKGETPFAMAQSQVNDPPTPIRIVRTDLPVWAEQVVVRSLAKKPEERFQSAIEFHESFARCLTGQPMAAAYSSSAPTELMVTPPRAMPTVTLEQPASSGQVPVSTRADSGWQPTISGQTPVGLPSSNSASGSIATAPVAGPPGVGVMTPVEGVRGPTGREPVGPQPSAATAANAPGSNAGVKRKSSIGLVVAASVILAVGVGGFAIYKRMRPSQPAETQVASVPVETSVAPPPVAPEVPAPPPVVKPTAPAVTSATSTPAAGSAAPVTPGARSTSTGPRGSGRGAAAVEEPIETINNVKFAVVNGKKTSDRDVVLSFGGGQISATPKNGDSPIFAAPYSGVRRVTYVHARDPRWDESQPGPPEDLDVGGILRTSKHWVVLQGDAYYVLKFEDSNIIRAIQTIESRTGVTVARPRDEKK